MANQYVYSGAGGAGTGADWANAHTTLSAAITAAAAGDVYYVAHDHAANYGVTTALVFKGTTTAPDRVLCVDRAGSVPPVVADLRTTALEGTNATSSNLQTAGYVRFYGFIFAPGSGQSSTCTLVPANSTGVQVFEDCQFHLLSTAGGSTISVGSGIGAHAVFIRPQFKFSHVSQGLRSGNAGGCFSIIGDPSVSILAAGSSVPTNFMHATNFAGKQHVRDADLSALTSVIVGANSMVPPTKLLNCKLNSSVTVSGTPTTLGAGGTEVIGCHSSGNVARNEKYLYQGTLTTETTIIRTGGASDGTTPYSWKIVPTANNERDFPFETFEGAVWNEDTGSAKTLTVHCVTDNVTLTDAEIWLEVEYLGSSATPIATLISDGPATVLTAGANQATSTEAWTTTGLTTPLYQKLEVTFTPQMVGPIRWRVKYAKASTTVYVCPKAELS